MFSSTSGRMEVTSAGPGQSCSQGMTTWLVLPIRGAANSRTEDSALIGQRHARFQGAPGPDAGVGDGHGLPGQARADDVRAGQDGLLRQPGPGSAARRRSPGGTGRSGPADL